MGDNSSPYPFVMELWDTVTNNITQVPHPPGFEASRFFRPVLATFDENSIIFPSSKVFNSNGSSIMEESWLYRYGEGWISLGKAKYIRFTDTDRGT